MCVPYRAGNNRKLTFYSRVLDSTIIICVCNVQQQHPFFLLLSKCVLICRWCPPSNKYPFSMNVVRSRTFSCCFDPIVNPATYTHTNTSIYMSEIKMQIFRAHCMHAILYRQLWNRTRTMCVGLQHAGFSWTKPNSYTNE